MSGVESDEDSVFQNVNSLGVVLWVVGWWWLPLGLT